MKKLIFLILLLLCGYTFTNAQWQWNAGKIKSPSTTTTTSTGSSIDTTRLPFLSKSNTFTSANTYSDASVGTSQITGSTITFNKTVNGSTGGNIHFNKNGTAKWTLGMDVNTEYFALYNAHSGLDVMAIDTNRGKIMFGYVGNPESKSADFTIKGITKADSTHYLFNVVDSTQSGEPSTASKFLIRSDGKIGIGYSTNQWFPELFNVLGNIKAQKIYAETGTQANPSISFVQDKNAGLNSGLGDVGRLDFTANGYWVAELSGTSTGYGTANFNHLNMYGGNFFADAAGYTFTNYTYAGIYINAGTGGMRFKQGAADTVPSSATDTGTAGEIRICQNGIYYCIATNTWVKTTLATW